MAMTKTDVAAWLRTIPAGALIWIDAGGMIIETDAPAIDGPEGGRAYLEIGGEPMPAIDTHHEDEMTVDDHCPECGEFEAECTCGDEEEPDRA